MKKKSGILLHITSLPNNYGIGTLGKEAYEFVDFINKCGQTYWQVLPVGPTTYKDSPYQSFSAFAGNPYFIDLEFLCEEGLLNRESLSIYNKYDKCNQDSYGKQDYVNYEVQYNTKFKLLKEAYESFVVNESFRVFKEQNFYWVDDYALFMTIKNMFNGDSWLDWPNEYKKREKDTLDKVRKEEDYKYWIFIQYIFDKQWKALKHYANSKDIEIIGDMPIYVAMDSADVWKDPKSWQISDDFVPTHVAGCPPDMFAPLGQLWGNPLYNYDKMREDGYKWWILRVKKSFELFDVLRIDHFRGFEAYYAIEYGRSDATKGEWRKGPNVELFKAINNELGELDIIAEDLGFLTQEVYDMLANLGYPGMKIYQFGFNKGDINNYSPRNIIENCVLYPGTHDNPTIKEWFDLLNEENKKFVLDELNSTKRNVVYDMLKKCLKSKANRVIIPIQDYLLLGKEGRMNTPGTDENNWVWKLNKNQLTDALSRKIKRLTKKYNR